MTLKYAVYPGMVTSKKDGQRHAIPSQVLMHLYNVNPEECLVISSADPDYVRQERQARATRLRLVPLHPRFSGDYSLPAADCS